MSHREKTIICPNCGFHAVNNYCSECGQETHLHKETFWGLVSHFIGHYFHYDSKFWQTMKALWFSPGKLTLAYWNKQRMRYIPPISLYIFISAVYFLLTLSISSKQGWFEFKASGTPIAAKTGSVYVAKASTTKIDSYLDSRFQKIKDKYGDVNDFVLEKANHNLSKIFFFMIPVMAMLLKLLFIRRRSVFFVDHAIFSLHYHSFWFSIFLLDLPDYSLNVKLILRSFLVIIAGIYIVMAFRNVYKVSWLRSAASTFVLGIGYLIFLAIIFLISLLLIVAFA